MVKKSVWGENNGSPAGRFSIISHSMTTSSNQGGPSDALCVGGGVIGLVTAYELASRGARVTVVDRGPMGAEASWAGAGIVGPAQWAFANNDDDRLRAVSYDAFPTLAERLRESTGIDIGYRRSGGVELISRDQPEEWIDAMLERWRSQGIDHERLTPKGLRELEPFVVDDRWIGFHVPGVCQVRNPRYLRALVAACQSSGVSLRPGAEVVDIVGKAPRIEGVRFADGSVASCSDLVITSGAWSGLFSKCLGYELPVRPLQGQMIAFQTESILSRILMREKCYLVPRDDGVVLAGSTEDEVGFAKQTTEKGLQHLLAMAFETVATLRQAPIIARWAGLRPASPLDHPIIGRAPGWDHVWLGTGHFRHGLAQSPGTGLLLADWISGRMSFAPDDAFLPSTDRPKSVAPFLS